MLVTTKTLKKFYLSLVPTTTLTLSEKITKLIFTLLLISEMADKEKEDHSFNDSEGMEPKQYRCQIISKI